MAEGTRHYFASGHTAAGAFSLYESAFQGLQTIYILKGARGIDKSGILQHLATSMMIQERGLQMFHCPLENEQLEGLIVTNLGIGIVDSNAWDGNSHAAAAQLQVIDLGEALDQAKLSAYSSQIKQCEQQLDAAFAKAYETFATTLRIHDEWEVFYISSMDRDKANQISEQLSEEIPVGAERRSGVSSETEEGARTSSGLEPKPSGNAAVIRHLFLGAATWRGAVDYIPSLTSGLNRRIFVKGRPGSGKSTLFKKLALDAEQRGVDVEVFHCGFDPNSLDMLIFPTLSLAIFDSTAPHEHFPDRDSDQILDMYERTMKPGTDEEYAVPIAEIKGRYTASMQKAIGYLAEAKVIHDRLKGIYGAIADRSKMARMERQLQAEIDEHSELFELLNP